MAQLVLLPKTRKGRDLVDVQFSPISSAIFPQGFGPILPVRLCYRLEECMLTGACCESLASVLTTNKTLERLNILQNQLGDEGVVKLLQSLILPECVLQIIG